MNHLKNLKAHRTLNHFTTLRLLSTDHNKSTSNTSTISPVRLAYVSYETTNENKQPPLIIMHGLLGSKQNWNSVGKAIHAKTQRKVISVDARNHGDSPHNGEHTYPHLAEDVKHLLDNLGLSSAALLGHSMGGQAMMMLALKYPHLVASVIIADISPVSISPNINLMSHYFDIMRKVKINPNVSMAQARKIADLVISSVVPDQSLRSFLITNLVKTEHGYSWRANIDVLDANFSSNISRFPKHSLGLQYRGPTLFIGGGNSDYIKKSDEPEIKKLFPNADIRTIDGAGHWLHADKPNEFLNIVQNFLNHN